MNNADTSTIDDVTAGLDPEVCRRARLSRDSRFDGEFYLAVHSTGIYCRPVCPARAPRENNVSYYRTAAQAAGAGYRPCLRCRPESAPGSPAWQGSRTTVNRALALIREGALNEGNTTQLSERLGVGERYLRKLFTREVGVSPGNVARTERLLFAKKLLTETDLPITDIAYAAGFGSTRRFNSFMREQMRCTPSSLRLTRSGQDTTDGTVRVQLQLQYRPPLDWRGLHNYFTRHAIAGVEDGSGDGYQRSFRQGSASGWLRVTPNPGQPALAVELVVSEAEVLMPVVARLRTVFDLDANPDTIDGMLQHDALLGPLVTRYPGTRSPVCWSPFESAVRAVVGQQVSLAGAATVLADIVQRVGCETGFNTGPAYFFPKPEELLLLESERLAMPLSRQASLMAVARYFAARSEDMLASHWRDLEPIRGIGPWTIEMIAMRGYAQPDAWPATDLGLLKSAASLGLDLSTQELQNRARDWQPWRAYAANLLWRNLVS